MFAAKSDVIFGKDESIANVAVLIFSFEFSSVSPNVTRSGLTGGLLVSRPISQKCASPTYTAAAW